MNAVRGDVLRRYRTRSSPGVEYVLNDQQHGFDLDRRQSQIVKLILIQLISSYEFGPENNCYQDSERRDNVAASKYSKQNSR